MKRACAHGFTFIEVILTLVIIGTGLFGITYLYSNMSYQMYAADLQIMAAELAQQKMEQEIALKAFSGYAAIVSDVGEDIANGPYNFFRITHVEFVDPNTMAVSVVDTGYKRIIVTVSWSGSPGVTLVSLVTNQVPLL